MKLSFLVALLVAFIGLASASQVAIVDPVTQTISSGAPGILDLGVVGPGQTVELSALRASGQPSRRPGYEGKEALWDQLIVDQSTLPAGWRKEDGKIYEEPMKAFVIVDPNAADGDYQFEVRAWDEGHYEGVDDLRFKIKVHVSRDVMDFSVAPNRAVAGTGQPAIYTFTIRNKGAASDVFEISATGLPTQWRYKKNALVRHGSETEVRYEVVAAEQGDFSVQFNVVSRSSPLITKSASVGLQAQSSVWEDMKAASHGIPLFPSSLQVVYGIVGLIANLIG